MDTLKSNFTTILLLLALCGAGASRAEVVPLGDEELSDVWGQSLLEIHNSSLNGYDFARFTLNADIDISANLGSINAGIYEAGSLNMLEGGVALDIGTLQLGRSDGSDAQRLVALSNPYLELAYSDIESDLTRRLVGMRMGFEGVDGDLGVAMTALTGAVLIDLGDGLFYDSLLDVPGAPVPPTVPLLSIGTLRAGNQDGPSRDFFVSVLSQALVYPAVKGLSSEAAMPGLWVNWRDRLSGMVGATPPNQSK